MIFPNPYSQEPIDSYLEISFDQFQLMGRSIAGVETVISIPQWNINFDTGRVPSFAFVQDYVALSHWHLDHAGGLATYLALRCLNSLSILHILVPEEKYKEAEEYLTLLKKISDSQLDYSLMSAKKPVVIRKDLQVRAIQTFHCTPSAAYLVEQKRQKLVSQFQDKSQSEIIKAKSQGVEVAKEVVEPLLAFSGDTKGEFLTTEATRARYLLMECSFFGEDVDYEAIRYYGHTHIKDWKKYAENIQSETVVMIHTSQRYTKKEIEKACVKYLPKNLLDRLIVFR